jgi:hypothetical protein
MRPAEVLRNPSPSAFSSSSPSGGQAINARMPDSRRAQNTEAARQTPVT